MSRLRIMQTEALKTRDLWEVGQQAVSFAQKSAETNEKTERARRSRARLALRISCLLILVVSKNTCTAKMISLSWSLLVSVR